MRKSFILTVALMAALFAALLMGCEFETKDNNSGGSNTDNGNTDNTSTGGATMTWSGDWTRVSENKYISNEIGSNANTIERLDIAAISAGTVTIQITVSNGWGYNYGYGYASKLDTGVSTSDYQMGVSGGTKVATYTYTIPSGSHWIQFMYRNDYDSSGSVTVEIIASSFTSSNTKLKVQNQSSVTLSDVKWGNTVVSASLSPSESKTVDVTEGSGYLYFTKGSASGLKCRTQEVITVSKDETKELTLTNNTLVVALDDTNNPQTLGTINVGVSAGAGTGPSLTWTGNWTRVSENKYTSNAIGDSANTIERLNIAASSAGTVAIQITASNEPTYDFGYASRLDTGVSTSNYQMWATRTNVATYAYTIPSGSHWIQFMYQKDSNYTSGSDSVTVEVISINY